MLKLYCDYQPVGWREFGAGGFAKGVLQGKQFRTEGEDKRVGNLIEFEGKDWVITGVQMVAGKEFFTISDGEDFEHVIAENYIS